MSGRVIDEENRVEERKRVLNCVAVSVILISNLKLLLVFPIVSLTKEFSNRVLFLLQEYNFLQDSQTRSTKKSYKRYSSC